jgi:leucyl aminopeptidase
MVEVSVVLDLDAAARANGPWDAVVWVAPSKAVPSIEVLRGVVESARRVDASLDDGARLVMAPDLAGGRLVVAAVGSLDRDHDDVRRFADAAREGVRRARDAGARRPLLIIDHRPAHPDFAQAAPVAALAALSGLWEPLEAREHRPGVEPVEALGFGSPGGVAAEMATWVSAAEEGRRLARDLGGADPERMAPLRFAEHCEKAFADLPVGLEVVQGEAFAKAYPLAAAVARASMSVERHRPCVIRLTYNPEGAIDRTILLAGKGVTYDTGGADLKTGGSMAGMSRDKGGAAAVAGFVHAVARLRPKGLRVIAELGMVRNSIGADAFVSDEIVTSHAGVRVRIGNTDAEGRLVLADLLSHLRLRALSEPAAWILSVATLTGHAVRAVGSYSIALDNRAARQAGVAARLAEAGDAWGDPFEVSRLRREDWDFVKPRSKADDVLSCNNAASSATPRGHQFPAAFLAIASGLDRHSHRSSDPAIAFTHVDIGGSAMEGCDWQHGRPTGAPVVGLLAALVENARPW